MEEGTHEVPSYIELVTAAKNATPPLDVLRWWFTLKYDAVRASEARDAYELVGKACRCRARTNS